MMRSWLVASLMLLPTLALADQAGIRVEHAWSRAMPAGATGVVYLTVTARGTPDTLTGVASPVAAAAGLHQSTDEAGVIKMRPVASLPLRPGKPLTLAPGGYHIMLTGLKQALVAGASFPVTLTFARAGAVTVVATVEPMGAAMPAMHQGGMGQTRMDMHGGTGGMDMRGMPMGRSGSRSGSK